MRDISRRVLVLVVWGIQLLLAESSIRRSLFQEEFILSSGLNRSFVFIPGRISNALAIDFHGFTQTIQGLASISASLQEKGFPVLFPIGYKHSWNGDFCCGEAKSLKIDDITFIETLIEKIIKEKFPDNGEIVKIFVSGQSNGAFFTSKFALTNLWKRSKLKISGIVLISAYSYDDSLYLNAERNRLDSQRFPVLIIHGLADTTVNLKGCCSEYSCCCEISSPVCFPLSSSFQYWQRINSCEETTRDVPLFFEYHDKFSCVAGNNCAAPLTMCLFEGVTHTIPFAHVAIAEYFWGLYKFSSRSPTKSPIKDFDFGWNDDSDSTGDEDDSDKQYNRTYSPPENISPSFKLFMVVCYVVFSLYSMKRSGII